MFESYFSLLKLAELSRTEKLPHKVPTQQNLNGRFLTSMHMNKLTLNRQLTAAKLQQILCSVFHNKGITKTDSKILTITKIINNLDRN